jgi:hypothetical protein
VCAHSNAHARRGAGTRRASSSARSIYGVKDSMGDVKGGCRYESGRVDLGTVTMTSITGPGVCA